MSRRSASFTEADIARITAGAKRKGAHSVDVFPDGNSKTFYRINLDEKISASKNAQPLPTEEEFFTL